MLVVHTAILAFIVGFATLQTSTTVAATPAASVDDAEAFRAGLDALLVGLDVRLARHTQRERET